MCTIPLDDQSAEVTQHLVAQSRRATTVRTYNAYLPHWLHFVRDTPVLSRDPFLRTTPPEQVLLLLGRFFHFLIHDRHLTAGSIRLAWSSITMHFDSHLQDPACLHSRLIMRLYQGAQAEAERMNPTQRRLPRMPIPLEALHTIRPSDNTPVHPLDPTGMIELALRLAAHYGARSSEYTFDKQRNAQHTLLTTGVVFIVSGNRVPAHSLRSRALLVTDCSHVHVRWPSTKINPKIGDLGRSSPILSTLLEDLFRWSARSLCLDSDPFFAIRDLDRVKTISPMALNTYLKSRGVSQGLNPDAVSSHSARRGSATQRTASGQSKETIHAAIGWAPNSNTSDLYTDHVPTLDPSRVITFDDLRQQYPAPATRTPSIANRPTSSSAPVGGGRTRNILPVRSSSDLPTPPSQQWWNSGS